MSKYRIVRKWDSSEAKGYYQLEVFVPYDENHSCYGCYDDWKRNRKKCRSNGDKWEISPNASGDLKWAKRNAEHYELTLPNPKEYKDKGVNDE